MTEGIRSNPDRIPVHQRKRLLNRIHINQDTRGVLQKDVPFELVVAEYDRTCDEVTRQFSVRSGGAQGNRYLDSSASRRIG